MKLKNKPVFLFLILFYNCFDENPKTSFNLQNQDLNSIKYYKKLSGREIEEKIEELKNNQNNSSIRSKYVDKLNQSDKKVFFLFLKNEINNNSYFKNFILEPEIKKHIENEEFNKLIKLLNHPRYRTILKQVLTILKNIEITKNFTSQYIKKYPHRLIKHGLEFIKYKIQNNKAILESISELKKRTPKTNLNTKQIGEDFFAYTNILIDTNFYNEYNNIPLLDKVEKELVENINIPFNEYLSINLEVEQSFLIDFIKNNSNKKILDKIITYFKKNKNADISQVSKFFKEKRVGDLIGKEIFRIKTYVGNTSVLVLKFCNKYPIFLKKIGLKNIKYSLQNNNKFLDQYFDLEYYQIKSINNIEQQVLDLLNKEEDIFKYIKKILRSKFVNI